MPGIFKRRLSSRFQRLVSPSLSRFQQYSTSLAPFNLWRRRYFEPGSRAIVRGTVSMVAIFILLAYTVHTIVRGVNPATLYGRRSFRRTGNQGYTVQPHLFTNHCTSAMMPGSDQNAFASLIKVGQLCDDGSSWGKGIQQIADCNPVWYNVGGDEPDVVNFRNFYAESGGPTEGTIKTSTCLALECPSCSDKNLFWYATYISLTFPPIMTMNGTSIWHPAAVKLGHIGSTAIWPWNNVSNSDNGKNLTTQVPHYMPVDHRNTPFLARNGTHNMAVIAYTESSFSISSFFGDFIGLPNQYSVFPTYGYSVFGPSRQAKYSLEGDASLVLWRDIFNGYDATQDYTASTLPTIIGSIGGLWSAFGGVLAGIFGTSMAFIVFGSKPISIKPPLIGLWKNNNARRLLDKRYLPLDKEIDDDARLRAVTAYIADYLVDTGELDLALGRMPREMEMYDLEKMGAGPDAVPVEDGHSPLASSCED